MKNYLIVQFRIFILIMLITSISWIKEYCQEGSPGEKQEKKQDWSKIYEKVRNSVVLIDFPDDDAREVGSGVVVGTRENGDAYVLTAYHVIKGFSKVLIYYYGNLTKADTGFVVKGLYSETDDIAVIEVINPSAGLEAINFSKKTPTEGTNIGTIGHPEGNSFSWTDGTINYSSGKYVFHDAKLKIGNSGGPLLDACNRMVGMNIRIVYPENVVIERANKPDTIVKLKSGGSVTLASGIITTTLENWIKDKSSLKDQWKVQKYCSFRRSPGFYVPAATAAAGTVVYMLAKPSTKSSGSFGEPPEPPGN